MEEGKRASGRRGAPLPTPQNKEQTLPQSASPKAKGRTWVSVCTPLGRFWLAARAIAAKRVSLFIVPLTLRKLTSRAPRSIVFGSSLPDHGSLSPKCVACELRELHRDLGGAEVENGSCGRAHGPPDSFVGSAYTQL